jgi:TIR domain-containing protein
VATLVTDYSWELFVTYKRDDELTPWVERVLRILTGFLKNDLGGWPPRVYMAPRSIPPGAQWTPALREGVRGSRCAVGLWSPEYFNSSWCQSEWKSFQERERQKDLKPGGLVYPIALHDPKSLPAEARAYQIDDDLSPFVSYLGSFWDSQPALMLEGQLKQISKKLAAVIKAAPPFDPSFPFVEVPESELPAPPWMKMPRLAA